MSYIRDYDVVLRDYFDEEYDVPISISEEDFKQLQKMRKDGKRMQISKTIELFEIIPSEITIENLSVDTFIDSDDVVDYLEDCNDGEVQSILNEAGKSTNIEIYGKMIMQLGLDHFLYQLGSELRKIQGSGLLGDEIIDLSKELKGK